MRSELTLIEAAVAMGLGTVLSTGCGIGDQTDYGGADYGDAGVGGSEDEWYEETHGSSSSSSSTSDSSSSSDTTESTSETESSSESTGTGTSETGGVGLCGWSVEAAAYACGFEGSDPGGTPIECPAELVAGEACADVGLGAAGCCDADGNLWFCEGELVVLEACIQE